MILNMNPRDCTVKIERKTYKIGNEQQPFMEALESEAMKLKKLIQDQPYLKKYLNNTFQELKNIWSKEAKKTNQIHRSFVLISALGATPTVPKELVDVILILIAVLAVIGAGGAMICGMIAGIWKMVNGKEKADRWTQDIIKGLTQVFAAPIVVLLVVTVFALLFGHLAVFKPVLEPVKVFFQN